MRMQTDHTHARLSHEALELIEVGQGHPEFRMRPGSAHMMMVAAAHTGVDAYKDVLAGEQFWPRAQRMQVIQRDPHALVEAKLVFPTRGKIRCEQDPLRREARYAGEDMFKLALRHAFERQAGPIQALQDLRVPVRLHGIGPAINGLHLTQAGYRRIHLIEIVDIRGRLARRNRQQLLALVRFAPPAARWRR